MTPQSTDTAQLMEQILYEVKRVVVGQDRFLERVMVAMLAQGHLLVEGVPGLAKTLTVKTLANPVRGNFKRIQFTPDLMPSDVTGFRLFDMQSQTFQLRKGPVFTNLLLADEINRAPAKTQASLLEVMQERQVTIDGETLRLSPPFMTLATQNPVEHEGTYPLPEAQLDRFMFSLDLGYPERSDEIEIVRRTTIGDSSAISAVVSREDILAIQRLVRAMPVADHILSYAVDLASATRPKEAGAAKVTNTYLEWGAGPRASQYLILGAKAIALMKGRAAPDAADVRMVAAHVLAHRIVPNYRATGEGLKAIDLVLELVKEVPEPRY
ncbi:MAG: AAA family ATPase [Burkholderiales bacterium PBB4]|nr:MAG: AAA family ATPase [Burkholderiales bacterium PBB4]